MPWKEEHHHTHIHVHNDNKEIVSVLKEIRDLLKNGSGNGNDEVVKQEIMDGLNKAIADIKSTI